MHGRIDAQAPASVRACNGFKGRFLLIVDAPIAHVLVWLLSGERADAWVCGCVRAYLRRFNKKRMWYASLELECLFVSSSLLILLLNGLID